MLSASVARVLFGSTVSGCALAGGFGCGM